MEWSSFSVETWKSNCSKFCFLENISLGKLGMTTVHPKSMLATQNMLATATQAKNDQVQAQQKSVNNKGLDKMKAPNRLLTSAQASSQRKEV